MWDSGAANGKERICMKWAWMARLRRWLEKLGIVLPGHVHYIGGSDTLPPRGTASCACPAVQAGSSASGRYSCALR